MYAGSNEIINALGFNISITKIQDKTKPETFVSFWHKFVKVANLICLLCFCSSG